MTELEKELFELLKDVAIMRDLQKEYFKYRRFGDLEKCKEYERLIDQKSAYLLKKINQVPGAVQDTLL
jgi:hypothetical protein